MTRIRRPLVLILSCRAAIVCALMVVGPVAAGGRDARFLLSPVFPPPIAASCPQFPALNGPGVLCEDFDTDRNGMAGFQFTRLPVGVDPNDFLVALGDPNDDVLGYTQTGGPAPLGTSGRACSDSRGLGRAGCDAPVAEENDWHLHSPFEGPGAGYDPPNRPGIGAPDGGKAHSGARSMHWGRHVNTDFTGNFATLGDSQRFRQVAAFALEPVLNLGPAATLGFWHLISVADDENLGSGFIPAGTTFGGGQVQISLLGGDGRFERWRQLTPSFNGYDSTIQGTVSICQFDPGDDMLPPTDDTFCDHSPMWSDMGDVRGTDATCSTDTDGNDVIHRDCGAISSCSGGPGCTERGAIGIGVWARSAFDLSPFAGRQARLRWIGTMGGGWSFGVDRSFLEQELTTFYNYYDADDGWWIDDIVITDLRQGPVPCDVDDDQDGFGLCDDCDDANPRSWTQPSEAQDLNFFADGLTLSWSAPADAGGTTLVYDVVRRQGSTATGPPTTISPMSFWGGSCVESNDGSDTTAVDAALPPADRIFYYVVRSQNECPYGLAPVTTTSEGTPRSGRPCP